MSHKGKLIVFEGIDGVGKSTQCKLLEEYLRNRNHTVRQLKEPSDGQYGREIRKLASQGQRLDPEKEYQLFILDRKENVKNNILPSLTRGEMIILDRYYFSTIAYQGALGLSETRVREENESFAPRPDIVIILELPVDEALKRVTQSRGTKADSFETRDYLIRVKSIFDSFKDNNIIRVDASQSSQEVAREIMDQLSKRVLSNL